MRTDYVQRFVFEDLDIRGRLACLSTAWQRMVHERGYPGPVLSLLGHTTALSVLLGANQKGSERVSLQVQGSGPVRLLVCECAADLKIRGLAQYEAPAAAAPSERSLVGDGRLAVTLDDPETGRYYQSLVPLEGESLEGIFTHYLSQSEQLASFLLLRADAGALCGLLLEKLPGADARDADGWDRVRHLAGTLALEETRDAQPYDLLTRLFPEELLRVFRLQAVQYHCPYDEEKVKDVLRRLGRGELEAILAEKGEVVVRNEMCNHEYRFDARSVSELFEIPGATSSERAP